MIEINLNVLQKSETRMEWRTVTRGGKQFRQRFRVGQDESKTGFDEFFRSDTTICGNTKADIKKIMTLQEAGIEGGCHDKASFIIVYNDDSKAMYKVIEPIEIFGEKATRDISQIIGWDVVPEVIAGDFGKGIGSVQQWISGEQPYDDYYESGVLVTEKHIPDLSKMFVLDMLMGDVDRHTENVIIKGDRAYMIDNEDTGAKFSVTKSMKGLDERIAATHERRDCNSMLSWVEESEDPEILEKLQAGVMSIMTDVFEKSDDIKQYIMSKDYDDMEIRGSEQHKIHSIVTNLKDMKKYYDAHRSS